MAASFVVAAPQLPPAGNQQQQDMVGSGTTRAGPFEACVWGDFFVTYIPPPSQRSEEWMRERVQQLKGQVRPMFEAAMVKGTAATATLVDALERLGIDNHFQQEIGLALSHIHADELLLESGTDLHTVALCFRLLRQHGFWVSADVFGKFNDGSTGSFSQALSSDVRGLLSLYNAAHMASPGEEVLDDAIAFARPHLEAAAEGKQLGSPMAQQVSRSLGIPLPRFLQRIEAMHYVTDEYEQEEEHDAVILELAKLDYTLVKSLHLKELKELTVWWRDLYDSVKLTYSRDRIVEMYFWALGVYHTEEYSRGRILLTKVIALTTMMDDTYDVYATFEDSQKFNEAIQRWDESAVSILPEYLRVLYMKTLSNFKEFEDILEPDEKYRVSYVRKAYQSLSMYYLQEAKWSNENHVPRFKEHMDLTAVSTALPMLSLAALMGAGGHVLATKKTLEWGLREPDMFRACGEVGRLLNDIAAYKKGKNKKDVASSMECYLKEHGCTGEEAAAAFAAMTEHAWRRINWSCMEIDPVLLPAAQQVVVNLTRTCEIIYYGGRDAYTFGVDLRDLVTSLFLTPGPAY